MGGGKKRVTSQWRRMRCSINVWVQGEIEEGDDGKRKKVKGAAESTTARKLGFGSEVHQISFEPLTLRYRLVCRWDGMGWDGTRQNRGSVCVWYP